MLSLPGLVCSKGWEEPLSRGREESRERGKGNPALPLASGLGRVGIEVGNLFLLVPHRP